MDSRLLFRSVITCAVAAVLSLSAVAEEPDARSDRLDILLAQAPGYDPMRPMAPSPSMPAPSRGNPEFGGLIDAPGAEDTFYMCSGCHSIALVKQQSLSDARWDYLWTWMIEEQGMADPGEELREVILGYLKEHYSSEQ